MKTRPIFVAGALAAALGAAAWLPDSQGPGVFVFIVAVSAVLALWGADAIPRSPWNLLVAVLALALAAMAAVRSAAWFVVPGLMLAGAMMVVSVSPARSWISLLLSGLRPILHIGSVPKFFFYSSGLNRMMDPDRTIAVARTGVIASVLLVVFGALFASADQAFAHLLEQAAPDWDLGSVPARIVLFVLALIAVSALANAGQRLSKFDKETEVTLAVQKVGFTEWFVPLLLLDLLFATFVTVQFTVLFGGHDLVLRTAGLTYAEYAREGFFQLLVAAALSLGVVCAASFWSAVPTPKSKLVLNVLLGVLCLLTLVILASALTRLGLYEEAFGFTRARLVGHAVAWWMGGIFLIVLFAGVNSRTRWLPRLTIAYTAIAMLVFAGIDPENFIARENLERAERTGKLDLDYLLGLGPDATRALIAEPLDPKIRACLLWQQHLELEDEPWSDFNWSRKRARTLLDGEKLKESYCEITPRE